MTAKRLAVIGYPLGHTLSPAIHRAAIQALKLDLTYDAVETAAGELPAFLAELRTEAWLGCNVTVPHKQAVQPFLAEVSAEARAIGAVNTIVNRSGRLVGHNTDAQGFLEDLERHFGPVQGKSVAVLGAGGAARAVCHMLATRARLVWVINRTPERAAALIAHLGGSLREGTVRDLAEAELIINCTSAGLRAGDSPVADECVPRRAQVYDLIYNPPVTRLMQAAIDRGGRAVNGLGMLVWQAAGSFRLWTGLEPPIEVMFEAVRA